MPVAARETEHLRAGPRCVLERHDVEYRLYHCTRLEHQRRRAAVCLWRTLFSSFEQGVANRDQIRRRSGWDAVEQHSAVWFDAFVPDHVHGSVSGIAADDGSIPDVRFARYEYGGTPRSFLSISPLNCYYVRKKPPMLQKPAETGRLCSAAEWRRARIPENAEILTEYFIDNYQKPVQMQLIALFQASFSFA